MLPKIIYLSAALAMVQAQDLGVPLSWKVRADLL